MPTRRQAASVAALAAVLAFPLAAADLEKARALRNNGLLEDAKREALDIAFDDDSVPDVKAEALMLLGDIAIDERNPVAAKENWSRLLELYPSSPAAGLAREKLRLVDQLVASPTTVPPAAEAPSYPPGTVLVVSDPNYPWAAVQIAGAIRSPSSLFEGSLPEAIATAGQDPSVVGVVEVRLTTDAVYESGRVVCYRPQGGKIWQEKVMFNIGGGEERIARGFVDRLVERLAGRSCP